MLKFDECNRSIGLIGYRKSKNVETGRNAHSVCRAAAQFNQAMRLTRPSLCGCKRGPLSAGSVYWIVSREIQRAS